MRMVPGVLLFAAVALTAGCADLNHFKQKADIESSSYSLDAKQRLVVSLARTDGSGPTRRYVCAEPSPDALATIATSGALSAELAGQGGGSASGGLSEAAAAIGLRTPTIQLLRDGLYRVCEAYMNGAIDEFGYALLLNQYDNTMVSLIGIEALAGLRPAAQVALGGKTTGETAGKQDTAIPIAAITPAAGPTDGGAARETADTAGAAPTMTVVIETSAKTGADSTTIQFTPPPPTGFDAETIAVLGPFVTEIVERLSRGSTVLGACMMWMARAGEEANAPKYAALREYCDARRAALEASLTPAGACMRWLTETKPGAQDEQRAALCREILLEAAKQTPASPRAATVAVADR